VSWTNFKIEEFKCRHCGLNLMDHAFIDKMQRLRTAYGHPIVINSGYRCPEYNQQISTTGPNGPHTTGRAVDVDVNRESAFQLLACAINSKAFTGIGVKQHGTSRFLHLDDLLQPGHPRPNIWSYA
jgi:zinc D-Ala-D-Ala carboxypeptidase